MIKQHETKKPIPAKPDTANLNADKNNSKADSKSIEKYPSEQKQRNSENHQGRKNNEMLEKPEE